MKEMTVVKTLENKDFAAFAPEAGSPWRCCRRTVNALPEPGPVPDG